MKTWKKIVNMFTRMVAPVSASVVRLAIAASVVIVGTVKCVAQTTNFPDPSSLYTNAQAPFNSALTWVIGATAVMVVIGWILKAVRRR